MRPEHRSALAVAALVLIATGCAKRQEGVAAATVNMDPQPMATQPAAAAQPAPMEAARAVAGGGIMVAGWMGKIDANEERAGQVLSNAKLAPMGNGMHVTTGPAVTYWNPANRATGDYTVRATFMEPRYMSLNDHPHPYGIMIGGNDLGTEMQSYVYCAAYGNGNFIMRGMGPAPFQVNGRRGEPNAAVNKAAGPGQPVTQEIAVSVRGDKVECAVNGTVVGSYDRAAVVGEGKLKSTDGVFGIRFAHNTEAMVTGLRCDVPGSSTGNCRMGGD